MFGRNGISDRALLDTVNQRIARTGTGSQTRLQATVRQGTVTLTGTLQYERQRTPILKATRNVSGVRNVIDQLVVAKKPDRG
jgi:osmotically-inducible protein OsmY